jgi:mono/diheme cytochrome c family protein
MKRTILTLTILALAAAAGGCAASDSQSRQLARGKYLVENVGMCADCHTPRGERGAFDRARWLQGSRLDFKPTVPMPAWAEASPPIAGLPTLSEADAVQLLETGATQSGRRLRPPMPEFRFTREDAEAVVAHLKSLKAN